jgi:hypothetical protein
VPTISDRIQAQTRTFSQTHPQRIILAKISEVFASIGGLEEASMDIAYFILGAMVRACPEIVEISNVDAHFFRRSDQDGWAMVQWKWKRDVDVSAFFSIDKGTPLGVVILFGTDRAVVKGRYWGESQLKWWVTNINHLRALFPLVHLAFPTAGGNFRNNNAGDLQYQLLGCVRF